MDARLPGVRVWQASRRAIDETPPERDRVVDLLRVASLMVVVFGHVLMAVARWHGDRVRIANLLAEVPALELATWALQVMPVFFAAGAIANRRSLATATGRGISWREWLWQRLLRLMRPTVWYLLLWVPIVWLLATLVPDSAANLSRLSTQLLWFLGVYVFVIATTRWQVRLAQVGYPAVAGLLAVIGLVDLLRFHVASVFGLANFVLVWFMTATLGLVVRDHVGRGRVTFVVFALGAATVNAVLIGALPYPISMVGLPDARISNMAPPTVVLALHSVVLLSLVGCAWPTLDRVCRRAGVWRVVAAVGAATMTFYLWHLTALVGVTAVEHELGITRGFVDDPAFWVTTAGHTVVVVVVAVLVVSLMVPLEHLPLPWVERVTPRPGASRWWTTVALAGVTCVGVGFLAMAATGMEGFPASKVTHYFGIPLTPGAGFLLLAGGMLLVRASIRRVAPDPARAVQPAPPA
jgi:hypothetical protein